MKHFKNFIFSPIGSKIIMALGGAGIIFFLIGHALGNLLIFNGPQSLNTYAHWLQNNPFLWIFRIGMLTIFFLHVVIAIRLTRENRQARPIPYAVNTSLQLGFSEKTMIFSGSIIFIFIIFHLAHLTLGWLPTTSLTTLDENAMLNVYQNVVKGFQVPWISGIYIFVMLIIGLHLHHSLKSLFQTLGFHHQNFHLISNALSPVLIIALILAFIAIPIAVLTGVIS